MRVVDPLEESDPQWDKEIAKEAGVMRLSMSPFEVVTPNLHI